MTIKEVQEIVEAYVEKRNIDNKLLKNAIYNNSYLTALFVGQMLGGKKISSYEEIFPEEKTESVEPKTNIADEVLKDRLRDFARKANEQRKNRGK